jgi:hypothetical protein
MTLPDDPLVLLEFRALTRNLYAQRSERWMQDQLKDFSGISSRFSWDKRFGFVYAVFSVSDSSRALKSRHTLKDVDQK